MGKHQQARKTIMDRVQFLRTGLEVARRRVEENKALVARSIEAEQVIALEIGGLLCSIEVLLLGESEGAKQE